METTATLSPSGPATATPGPIERVFTLLGGPTGVLRALRKEGIEIKTPWAVSKWLRAGRLPRTEYTGETKYAQVLERAVDGQVTAEQLLEQGRRG
jgi:hypothetical protein